MRTSREHDHPPTANITFSEVVPPVQSHYSPLLSRSMSTCSSDSLNQFSTRYSSFFVSFFILFLGICSLTPWNVFLAASDLFMNKLNGTAELHKPFVPVAGVAQNIMMIITNVLVAVFLYRFCTSKRVFLSLLAILTGFVVLTCLVNMNFKEYELRLFIYIIMVAACLSVAVTILQTAIFSMLTTFPFSYTNSFLIGQGLAGTSITVIRIICLSVGSDSTSDALMFFIMTIVLCVCAFFSFLYVMKSAEYRKYTHIDQKDVVSNTKLMMGLSDTQIDDSMMSEEHVQENEIAFRGNSDTLSQFANIIKKSWIEFLSLYLAFFMTLGYFPMLGLKIVSAYDTNEAWSQKYFIPVTLFLAFNLGDFIGRILTKYLSYPPSNTYLMLGAVASRALFIIPYLMCNWGGTGLNYIHPLLSHDIFPFLINLLFGITGGYYSTIILIYTPSSYPNFMKEKVGNLLILVLGMGLFSGSMISFAVRLL